MIRHIVFFDTRNATDSDAVFNGLSLLTGIPHKLHLEIGRNLKTDPLPGPVPDFVVYGEFESEAQLAAFKAHPLYQQSIDAVRPLRDLRVAADFDAG